MSGLCEACRENAALPDSHLCRGCERELLDALDLEVDTTPGRGPEAMPAREGTGSFDASQ